MAHIALKSFFTFIALLSLALKAYPQKQLYKNDSTFNFKAQSPTIIDKISKLNDGGYILSGSFDYYNDTASPTNLKRLDGEGNIIKSLKSGVYYSEFISKVIEQPDGKLLVLRSVFQSGRGYELNRLHADGTHDPNFTLLAITGSIHTAALQQDGKILIGGAFNLYSSPEHKNLVRLNPDGSLDASFTTGTGPDGKVLQILLKGDEILVSGEFNKFNNHQQSGKLILLSKSGELIKTYFPDGFIGSSCSISSIESDEAGNIYFFTDATTAEHNNSFLGLGKITSGGEIDRFFINPFAYKSTSSYLNIYGSIVNKISIHQGKILLTGFFQASDVFNLNDIKAIVRILPDGEFDYTYQNVYGNASDIAVDGNHVLLVGNLGLSGNIRGKNILKLDINGYPVHSFNPLLNTDAHLSRTFIQNDSTVFLAGNHYYLNDSSSRFLSKISTKGKVDASFEPSLNLSSTANLVSAIDGIYIGERSKISKLKYNGDLDTSFSTIDLHKPFTPLVTISAFCLSADGNLIVSYFQNDINRIVKYSLNGEPDPTFNSGTFRTSDGVYVMATQPDGKILVGGNVTFYNGISVKNLFRLNSDGSLDESFKVGAGPETTLPGNAYINVIEFEPNGDILISGSFDTFNGIQCESNIIRLKADGSFKEVIVPLDVSISSVSSIAYVPSDSSIIITGDFLNKSSRSSYIQAIRLKPYVPTETLLEASEEIFSFFPNPVSDHVYVKLNGQTGDYVTTKILNSYGLLLYEKHFTIESQENIEVSINFLAPGIYFIEVISNNSRSVKRMVKL